MMPFRCADLVQLFQDENAGVRTTSLTLLCEGYANDRSILAGIFASWDRFGIEKAFADFPMLSYLPASAALLDEACQRAVRMVEGRVLTDPVTRSAGKLIEQQLQLPANELEPHMSLLRETQAKSKIFFRVDLKTQTRRIELLNQTADQLAQRLDTALADHCATQNPDAITDAMLSLEALRRQHPNYLELAAVLRGSPKEGGAAWASFCTTLQSLIQFAQSGLEPHLGRHLLDHREYVFSQAVEALVRCGTEAAGIVMLEQFADANARAQQWIARGLQRIRQPGLAVRISQIETDDAQLQSALLLAQLRQLDTSHFDLAVQLRNAKPMSASWLNLLYVNQRLWPVDATEMHRELDLAIQSLSAANSPGTGIDQAAARLTRETIRESIREQFRKAK